MGLKPLQEHSQPVKGCPSCSAPITGIARYARITNKAMNDLMDRKFAHENRMALRRVDGRLAELMQLDPQRAAAQGRLSVDVLSGIVQEADTIFLECQRPPSFRVRAERPDVLTQLLLLQAETLSLVTLEQSIMATQCLSLLGWCNSV